MKYLVISLCLLGTSAFAAPKTLWTCDNGNNIEGAGIYQTKKGTVGEITWDCMPGDGICTAKAAVVVSTDYDANTVYSGNEFTLVIDTTNKNADGVYKAHLKATDLTDSKDQGRGLTFDDDVTCKKGK